MNPTLFLSASFILGGVGIFFCTRLFSFDKYLIRMKYLHQRRIEKISSHLEDMFYLPSYKLILFLVFSPLIIGALVFIFTQQVFVSIGGLIIGFIIPSLFLRALKKRRTEKFNEQLIDGLMDISNSLKGGLSFLQAIEFVVSNSPSPLKDEFGLVLRESKMGLPLEESLQRLNKRINSDYLRLFTTAVLVGKEAGGNLIRIFSRLVTTIRERRKVNDKMKLMTFQGRLQAMIISILPFIFAPVIYKMDPHHFDVMLQTELGRGLLILAGILQVIALILIKIFSTLHY